MLFSIQKGLRKYGFYSNLKNYFAEQYKNKWLAFSEEKFKKLKEYQSEILEKARKTPDGPALELVEHKYQAMKQEFERIRAVIGELADVLDMEFPEYVVEEDKTLQYKQMIISNKDKVQDDAAAPLNAASGPEG